MKGSKLRKLVISTAIVVSVSFTAAGIVALSTRIYITKDVEGTSIDERRSLVLEGIDTIDTSTTSADIVIKATENREVEIHFHGTARTDNPDSLPRLVTERKGSVLYIYTERKKNISPGYFKNRLVLELYIPKNYRHRLTVHSVSGVIKLNDQIFSILTISSTFGKFSCKFPIRLSRADTGQSRNLINGDAGSASLSMNGKNHVRRYNNNPVTFNKDNIWWFLIRSA